MVSNFHLPPMGFGPGSQPLGEDGENLEYMPMPSSMRTFEAHLPEIKDREKQAQGLDFLERLSVASAAVADRLAAGDRTASITLPLGVLDRVNRGLVEESLGEGEVICRVTSPTTGKDVADIRESVFAGIWVIREDGNDRVEVAPVPGLVMEQAFASFEPALGPLTPMMPGVVNAPPLVTELFDKSRNWTQGAEPDVINLSLLPHTPEDLDFLDLALGKGCVEIQSRGYGECRVEATGLAHVWRVRFFNSMGVTILDTYEVTGFPEAAAAAREDFEDSAERIREVLEAIQ